MSELEITQEYIDPTKANALLELNTGNRKKDMHVVTQYARLMREGKWRPVGDPIRISNTNRLLDGQQRLTAIVESGTTQPMVVIRGLLDEDQAVIDTGKKRSPGDVLYMNGAHNANVAAGVSNICMLYRDKALVSQGHRRRYSNEEILEFYLKNQGLIDHASTLACSMKNLIPISPSVVGAALVEASQVADPFAVNMFFESLRTGLNLQPGNPIAPLRNWLIRRQRDDLRVGRVDMLYMVIRTWNLWATGEQTHRVQLPKGGLTSEKTFPEFVTPTIHLDNPITEDNPAVTPYSKTRKEME